MLLLMLLVLVLLLRFFDVVDVGAAGVDGDVGLVVSLLVWLLLLCGVWWRVVLLLCV